MNNTNRGTSGDDRMTAEEWLLSDKHRELLPTPWLDPYELEAFTRRLLRAQKFMGPDVRRVVRVEQYGVPGDKQDGIDLRGDFSDGAHAAWQCRHLEKLGAPDVRKAVADVTYQGATETYLVFAGIATRQAQDEMDKHPGWQLLDRRQLTDMLLELPAQQQRDILEQTWGDRVRRLFLEAPGDGFVSIDTFAQARKNPDAVMNDLGPLVGRDAELAALNSAVDRTGESARQVVVGVRSRWTREVTAGHRSTAGHCGTPARDPHRVPGPRSPTSTRRPRRVEARPNGRSRRRRTHGPIRPR